MKNFIFFKRNVLSYYTSCDLFVVEINCPDPGVPEHGSREGQSFRVGEKVLFYCFSGYYLLGSVERYCMPNGQWTGELARCNTESKQKFTLLDNC